MLVLLPFLPILLYCMGVFFVFGPGKLWLAMLSEKVNHEKWAPGIAVAEAALCLLQEHLGEWAADSASKYATWRHPRTGIVIDRPYDKDDVHLLANGCVMKLPLRYHRRIHALWRQARERQAADEVIRAVATVRDRLTVYQGGKA